MKTIRIHFRTSSNKPKLSIFQKSGKTLNLSEEDLKLLKDTTEMEENQIMEKHCSFVENHPTGSISRKSFDGLLSECFTKSSRKKIGGHLWRIYDLNMDGVVDFSEFLIVLRVMTDGTAEQNLKQIFRFFDVNLNGFIEKVEMERVVRDLLELENNNHNSSVIAERAFQEMSSAGGGEVSLEQFTMACLSNQQNTAMLAMKVINLFLDQ